MAQPLGQAVQRFGFTAGQHLDTAVWAIYCMAYDSQPVSLLPCRFPEPDSLNTPLNAEFPTLPHAFYPVSFSI